MNVRRPQQLGPIAPLDGAPASPQEAAAIVAALEQFARDYAPVLARRATAVNPWLRAALLEGVDRGGDVERLTAWGDPPLRGAGPP